MDKESKIKQDILSVVYERKELNVSELSSILGLSIDVCYSYSEEIHFNGYFDFVDGTTKTGKDAFVSLNGKGEVFFENGGYKAEDAKLRKQGKQYRIKNLLSNSSLIVTIITSCIAIVLGYLNYVQRNEIDDLREQLDSKLFKKEKKELVGRWGSASSMDSCYYEFFVNNDWLFKKQLDGKAIIYKGEYQVGKNGGVFLRRYGSQHWFHDTTYIDIRSGIGTSYLYIKDGELINNQEDYKNEYRKVK